VLFHSGTPLTYHADDQQVPFRSVPHFARWAPLSGPGHWLLYRPGERPRLARVVPADYWHGPPAPPPLPEGVLESAYEVCEVSDVEAAVSALGELRGLAYIGNDPQLARTIGIAEDAVEPAVLLASLDWDRGVKTAWEIACIRDAARLAARGHEAAREAALAGASERSIHAAYLAAGELTDDEMPYPCIVARNEAAAILHYEGRRAALEGPACSLLIDAGARCRGYASDITRTYALRDAHPVFAELLRGMEQLQADLAGSVGPGSFVELHMRAARGVCALLRSVGVLRVEPDEALEREIDRVFLPHGLGHHLGLQVHDVGGHQISPEGEQAPPPARAPHLRTTRPLAPGHVITIEPGLYFVPILLADLASGPDAECVDGGLLEDLRPCGGIRVEDDVLVTAEGAESLSRPFLPGATRA
jgi:Xaa-Pro dipeptidase